MSHWPKLTILQQSHFTCSSPVFSLHPWLPRTTCSPLNQLSRNLSVWANQDRETVTVEKCEEIRRKNSVMDLRKIKNPKMKGSLTQVTEV